MHLTWKSSHCFRLPERKKWCLGWFEAKKLGMMAMAMAVTKMIRELTEVFGAVFNKLERSWCSFPQPDMFRYLQHGLFNASSASGPGRASLKVWLSFTACTFEWTAFHSGGRGGGFLSKIGRCSSALPCHEENRFLALDWVLAVLPLPWYGGNWWSRWLVERRSLAEIAKRRKLVFAECATVRHEEVSLSEIPVFIRFDDRSYIYVFPVYPASIWLDNLV